MIGRTQKGVFSSLELLLYEHQTTLQLFQDHSSYHSLMSWFHINPNIFTSFLVQPARAAIRRTSVRETKQRCRRRELRPARPVGLLPPPPFTSARVRPSGHGLCLREARKPLEAAHRELHCAIAPPVTFVSLPLFLSVEPPLTRHLISLFRNHWKTSVSPFCSSSEGERVCFVVWE